MFTRVTVKHGGRYFDYPIEELDLDPERPVDADIKIAMSQRIATDLAAEQGVGPGDALPNLADFVVDPPEAERLGGQHETKEVLSIRPVAEYG